MSKRKQITKTESNIYTVLFGCIAILISAFKIVYTTLQGSVELPTLLPISGIFGTFLLFFALLNLFMYKGKMALWITAISIITAIITGIYFENILGGTLVAISLLSVGLCACLVYSGYKKGEQKSSLCAYSSFVFTIFELLRVAALIFVTALRNNVKFTTLLFGMLEEIINSYIGYYIALLENAAKLSPELYAQTPIIDTTLLYSSMATMLALIPAILFTGYFAVNFIAATLFDKLNKKHNIISGRSFSKYDVSFIVYVLFMVFGTIYIFSMFFEYTLSPATLGVLSVVLALLPHFVILAYRRLYVFFSRLSGKFGAIVFLLIISGAGFIFFSQLYLYILAFIGTSEYRRNRIEEHNNKNKFIS